MAFVIFDSLVRLHDAWRLRKAGGSVGGMLLPLAVSLVLGAVMLFDPFDAAESMMIAIGAILIVEGVMNLCTGVYAAARLRACLKEHPEVLDGETQRPTIEGDAPAVDVEFRDVSSTTTTTTTTTTTGKQNGKQTRKQTRMIRFLKANRPRPCIFLQSRGRFLAHCR